MPVLITKNFQTIPVVYNMKKLARKKTVDKLPYLECAIIKKSRDYQNKKRLHLGRELTFTHHGDN